MGSPPKNYANKSWPPRKVAAYLPCECIEVRNPPGRRCNSNWTRCIRRMKAIRDWQDQQPDKEPQSLTPSGQTDVGTGGTSGREGGR